MTRPPELVNPAEAAAASKILARPSNTPSGHTKVDDLRCASDEEFLPTPTGLDPDYTWVFPGLLYVMVGLDRSIFELYGVDLNKTIEVKTYRAESPVANFNGANVTANQWFYVLQGIPVELGQDFLRYMHSYVFRDMQKSREWTVESRATRIRDPFASDTVGHFVHFLLPRCSTGRYVTVAQAPGLHLGELWLSMATEVPLEHQG